MLLVVVCFIKKTLHHLCCNLISPVIVFSIITTVETMSSMDDGKRTTQSNIFLVNLSSRKALQWILDVHNRASWIQFLGVASRGGIYERDRTIAQSVQ